nr:unnamed protein product [Callosobruchus analis]
MECAKCKKVDNEPASHCDGCECLIHQECSELSSAELKKVDELFAEVERLKNLVGDLPCTSAQFNFEEVVKETEERNSRKQNLIVYGLPENNLSKHEQETQDDNNIKKMLEVLSSDARLTVKPIRLGKFDPTRPKPRPLTLSNYMPLPLCQLQDTVTNNFRSGQPRRCKNERPVTAQIVKDVNSPNPIAKSDICKNCKGVVMNFHGAVDMNV